MKQHLKRNIINKNLNFIIIFFSIFFTLFLIEVFLRLFSLSATSSQLQPVNYKNPIQHFKPDHEFRYANGWNSNINITHRTNNFGYNTFVNFKKNEEVKCIIGDSYVEALQVKNEDSFHGILNKKGIRTYPFGISGNALSDYVVIFKYLVKNFNCSKYIFLIINNDFEESLKKIVSKHHFDTEKNGELGLVEYKPSFKKKILRQSALVNYIYKNLNITNFGVIKKRLFNKIKPNPYGNLNYNLSKIAIDYFFSHLVEYNSEIKNIIFIIDGNRMQIYEKDKDMFKDLSLIFKYFMNKSSIYNIKYIDLHNIFSLDYEINNKLFNFENNYHWNEYAHTIVSNELLNSNYF